ncbi:hypothetical protein HPNQ4161_1563 [Helicobacter pylori NQ4161]|nr:hypothetical protein HPNQ4161_1563 [Helicobacter pylori NQ4161]
MTSDSYSAQTDAPSPIDSDSNWHVFPLFKNHHSITNALK